MLPEVMGCGTAWGGRFPCKEDIRWVRISYGPPSLWEDGGMADTLVLETSAFVRESSNLSPPTKIF